MSTNPLPVARQRSAWWALVAVTILALVLRLYHLGHENFWIDEVSSMLVARQPLHDIAFNYRPGMHPDRGAEQAPLALMVMHGFLSADASEASARLPSALFGIAAVVILYLFAQRLLPTPVALIAALFLAVSPLHIWYSQEARWYAQWIVLTILSYWALVRARDTGGVKPWLAYCLCSVLNVYTFILSFLVIASQGVSVLLFDRWRERKAALLPRFVLAQIAIAVVCTPVLWMIVKTMGLTTGTPRPKEWVELPYTFFIFAAGYSVGPTTQYLHALPGLASILITYPIVIVLAVVFMPLVVVGIRRALQQPLLASLLLPWCFVPPLLAFLISRITNVTYQARYSSAALPAFFLLLALGSLALRRRPARRLAVAAVVASAVWSLAHYYWDPQYAKEDVKDAIIHIDAAGLDAVPVGVVGQVDSAVAYYGPHLQVVPLATCVNGTDTIEKRQALWLLTGRDWNGATPGCLAHFTQTHAVADHRQFPGVDLWLFKARHSVDAATDSAVPARHTDGIAAAPATRGRS